MKKEKFDDDETIKKKKKMLEKLKSIPVEDF